MTDRILGLIGIARKASALIAGEDRVADTLQKGKAKMLLLPADAGRTAQKIALFASEKGRLQIAELPYSAETLAKAAGLSNCQIAALTDLGLAGTLAALLAGMDPEKYGMMAEAVSIQHERQERRKKKAGLKKKMKSAGEE